jgi:hypothetical protein
MSLGKVGILFIFHQTMNLKSGLNALGIAVKILL